MLRFTLREHVSEKPLGGALFGGNLLFDRDDLEGTFPLVVEQLGVTGLRYPGGGMTEKRDPETGAFLFDVSDPDRSFFERPVVLEDGTTEIVHEPLVPISEYISFASERELAMSFVIPTSETWGQNYIFGSSEPVPLDEYGNPMPLFGMQMDRVQDILDYTYRLIDGTYGHVGQAILELGNEFHSIADNRKPGPSGYLEGGTPGHTATTYGIVASYMAAEIEAYAVSVGREDDFQIHVQAGRSDFDSVKPKNKELNSLIIAEFDAVEMAAVDGVIHHFYPRDMSYLDLEMGAQPARIYHERLDYAADWSAAAGRALDYNVSEWNVGAPKGDTGLHGVAVLAESLAFFAGGGVDMASVWPLQQNTRNDLSGDEGRSELTLAGEFFRLASANLVDKWLIDAEDCNDAVRSYVYADTVDTSEIGDVTLILVNETAARITEDLLLGDLRMEGDVVTVTHLSVVPRDDAPVGGDHRSAAVVDTTYHFGNADDIEIAFDPHAVIVVDIDRAQTVHSPLLAAPQMSISMQTLAPGYCSAITPMLFDTTATPPATSMDLMTMMEADTFAFEVTDEMPVVDDIPLPIALTEADDLLAETSTCGSYDDDVPCGIETCDDHFIL